MSERELRLWVVKRIDGTSMNSLANDRIYVIADLEEDARARGVAQWPGIDDPRSWHSLVVQEAAVLDLRAPDPLEAEIRKLRRDFAALHRELGEGWETLRATVGPRPSPEPGESIGAYIRRTAPEREALEAKAEEYAEMTPRYEAALERLNELEPLVGALEAVAEAARDLALEHRRKLPPSKVSALPPVVRVESALSALDAARREGSDAR